MLALVCQILDSLASTSGVILTTLGVRGKRDSVGMSVRAIAKARLAAPQYISESVGPGWPAAYAHLLQARG
jgi:hypothetical protein